MLNCDSNQRIDSNPLRALSDEELVCRLVGGDQRAMALLFDRYYRMVMGVALRIVRDPGEAQDVVQVVFTDFYRSAKLFDAGKGSFKAWLLQYSYGRSINRKQSLNSRNFYNANEAWSVEIAENGGLRLFNLELPELRVLAREILGTLEEKQRTVIEMICFRGFTLAETASEMGESLGNVQHLYYRGLEKLRVFLKGQILSKKRAEVAHRTARFRVFQKREKRQHEPQMEIVKARTL